MPSYIQTEGGHLTFRGISGSMFTAGVRAGEFD
jgi:hypothetical protein